MIAFPIKYINSDKFKGGNAGGIGRVRKAFDDW